jgi:helicase SWR1
LQFTCGLTDSQLDALSVTPARRSAAQTNELTERPKFKIKRIKLIVRPPPLRISHPAQKPPQSKFGSSLNAFLSSYVTPFEQVIDEAVLERQIQKEAALFERAYWVRKEGRFLPTSENMTTESLNELRKSSFTPKRNSKVVWDHVVESVIAYKRTKKRGPGQQITGQIAAKIKAYWDAQEVKKEKMKAVTEKQLRTLARDTMKMVVNEWKKAVFVRVLS